MSVEILAVDDNPHNLQSLEAMLTNLGAKVVPAFSGDEALRHLLSRDFAVILLDIQMPNLDGYETAQLIRSRERTRHTPIIFLTAYDRTEENVLRGYALGAVDFLFKPILPEILKSKVQVFLDLYRKTEEIRRQAELLRDAEKRDHERTLAEARQRYEKTLLQKEMERERRVAEAHSQRAQELARSIALREEAETALHNSHERLELIAHSANLLLLESDPRSKVNDLFQLLSKQLGLETFLQYEFKELDGNLRLRSHAGLAGPVAEAFAEVRLGEGLIGRVAMVRHREVLEMIRAPADSEEDLVRSLGLGCLAVFPVVTQRELGGVLAFGSAHSRAFTADDLSLMQVITDQVAVALERARLIAQLKESDRRKDEFLAMLGHELRNPLAPIQNSIEVFRIRAGEDPVIQRATGAVERQVRHMTRLVDDLLDVSRITRGKVELRPEIVALEEVVEQAVHASEPMVQLRRHKLHVALPEEPIILQIDPSRLAQVFGNLLQNAAKYTEPGGEIHFSASLEIDALVVRVRDNGIGIRPEMQPRIFDMFVQEEPTSDRALGGLGLGLTLVRSLVEMHGGHVKVVSPGLGKGSEFIVRLPLPKILPEPADLALRRTHLDGAKLRPLSILVVEDNADIRLTMRDLLELHGHAVSEASDGHEAVELLLRHKPQVALVDIGLPGLDGYRVAEMVRASGKVEDTRLIALTGYGAEEAKQKAIDAGFDAHLVKPVSAQDLWGLLRRLC